MKDSVSMVSMGIHLHTFVDPCQKLTGGMAKNLSVKTGQSSALKTTPGANISWTANVGIHTCARSGSRGWGNLS